ncbi:MAG: histidinol-phosphate aminotransferase family protein [Chloroflexi bacterium]|nr:histidinol-phosphate aminotransferase family protein [Chloroflexota bacterium]
MHTETAIPQATDRSGPTPVPWIETLEPAVHGAVDPTNASRDGLAPDCIIDFSANGNVVGPSPRVAEAIARVDVSRYPDRDATALREAIAQRLSVDPTAIVAGNGSTEVIWAVARAYLKPGDVALVLGPTYGEYAVGSAACGAQVEMHAAAPPGETIEGDTIVDLVRQKRPRILWLCHPNNPTGAPFPMDIVARLVKASSETLIVVDEAYLTLCDGVPSALALRLPSIVVLRSLTKDAGLAGLRVGYAVAASDAAAAIRRVIPPWSVNSLAQAAALAALSDEEHQAESRRAVAAARQHLVRGLDDLGLDSYPSVANFVLLPIPDARRVTRELLSRGLAVRDCESFGLTDCIRIGVRPIPDQQALLDAMRQVL